MARIAPLTYSGRVNGRPAHVLLFLTGFAAAAVGACSDETSGGAGGAGPGGAGGEPTSTSGGGGTETSPCDALGSCGDFNSGCQACAVSRACARAYESCLNAAPCVTFSNCIAECGADNMCRSSCEAQHPDGKKQREDLDRCIGCEECPETCGGVASCNLGDP